MSGCVECGSNKRSLRRERCDSCYRRFMKALKAAGLFDGKRLRPGRTAKPPIARVLPQTTPGPGGCVIFTGGLCRDGYGLVTAANGHSNARAHRVSYEHFVGAIPAGHQLDHLCHTEDASCAGGRSCLHRRCVNPHHLEPVTAAENVRRGRSASALNRLKTHCPQGHAYDERNTIRDKSNNKRSCRTCANGRRREARQRA